MTWKNGVIEIYFSDNIPVWAQSCNCTCVFPHWSQTVCFENSVYKTLGPNPFPPIPCAIMDMQPTQCYIHPCVMVQTEYEVFRALSGWACFYCSSCMSLAIIYGGFSVCIFHKLDHKAYISFRLFLQKCL